MSEVSPENNPFSDENYREIEFTQLSKIYDVLMTLVQLQSPAAAERLLEAHSNGTLVGPSPVFTGEFLFDSANAAFEDSANAPSPTGDSANTEDTPPQDS